MKRLIFILLTFVLAASCTKTTTNPPAISLTGKWRMNGVFYTGSGSYDSSERSSSAVYNGIEIQLNDNADTGGISGHTLYNTFTGGYKLTNNTIFIDSFSYTKISESGWGNLIFRYFPSAYSYRISGNYLYVFITGNSIYFVFQKE